MKHVGTFIAVLALASTAMAQESEEVNKDHRPPIPPTDEALTLKPIPAAN